MFKGISEIKLDSKGRFALPKRIRQTVMENFAANLVVTVSPEVGDRCLLLYPLSYWTELEEELSIAPNTDPRVRKFLRLFIGHAEELSPDSAGRLLLSQPLRKYAGLQHTLAMVGQGKRWELWDEKLWQQYLDGKPSSKQIHENLPLQIAL